MKSILFFFILAFSFSSFADYKSRKPETYNIPPPPVADSFEEELDFNVLFDLQASRTQNDCEFAKAAAFSNFEVFWEVLINKYTKAQNLLPLFNPNEVQDFKAEINDVMKYTDKVTQYFKNKYKRLRPYDKNPLLDPCGRRPGGQTSYPSSHASKAFASSCVLASMFPEHAETLMKYAEYMAELRVIGGVHHPSDIDAGKDIGLEVCAEVLKSN